MGGDDLFIEAVDKMQKRPLVRINVQPAVLQWAVARSGREQELSQKFPRLAEWLTGENQPTLRQLEKFARATSLPFGYLLLAEPPEERLPIPHFRTLTDEPVRKTSPELLETVRAMQQRQVWMREYLIEQGHEPIPFVGSASINDPLLDVVQRIRAEMGLSENWASEYPTWTDALRALQARIEDVGILVVVNSIVGNNTHRRLEVTEFRGFVLVDEYAPLVFVNGADGRAAQMFTLTHELAHVWLGRSAAFDLRALQPADDPTEQACNQIAAEFLAPAAQLRALWPSLSHKDNPFQAVARRFKVSEIVVARRALDLNLITRQTFFEFYKTYQERAREERARDAGYGDFYATQNRRIGAYFGQAVARAVKEGRLLYREAYRLTGLYGRTFERYLESVVEKAE